MSEGKELATREQGQEQLAALDASPRTPDAYESEYMRSEGLTLYRDKSRAPWQLHALFGSMTLLSTAAAFTAPGAWIGALGTAGLLAFMWLLFSVLRVSVSEKHVNVQYGLFGPKIPIEAIESAEAIEYDWKSFGGWGIRMNREGEWMYNMPGDGGRAVRIAWRDTKGRARVTYVGSLQSEHLAGQIAQARALGPAPRTPELGPGSGKTS